MAIGNWQRMHERFSKHSGMGTARMKKYDDTDEDDKKIGMSMGKGAEGTKERSPDSVSLPNQNTILINIKWYYVKRYGNNTMKFNCTSTKKADDSTLMAVVPSPVIRVAVAESPIRDLGRVSEWCDLWGMKLNASKTKTMIVSRSRTMHPQSPPLTIGGTVLKGSDDLVISGVTF